MATFFVKSDDYEADSVSRVGLLADNPDCRQLLTELDTLGVESLRLFYRDGFGRDPTVHVFDIEPRKGVRLSARQLRQIYGFCYAFTYLLPDVLAKAVEDTEAADHEVIVEVFIRIGPTPVMSAAVEAIEVVADFATGHLLKLV
ncbi:MAG: hypothetical protein K8S94_15535 [Planctomycetia bacterium]|nr:hypothetical protein [Planctomycetia bacterium]